MTPRLRLFARAFALRCPNCGGGNLLNHWLSVADDCPRCGISLVRGNRVGAYIINIGVAEAITTGVIITLLVRDWPTPPWELLGWLAPLLAIVSPLAFYPFSRLLFAAADLAIHPNLHRDEDG